MPKFFVKEKKHWGTLSEVNVIPLVDIVFTLLIIFMILAPMIHKGIQVRVPESAVGETSAERDQHVISITKEGALWFDDQHTTLEAIHEHLEQIAPEETVYVQSDAAVQYGAVVEVISEIKANGIRNVGLVTRPRAPESLASSAGQ